MFILILVLTLVCSMFQTYLIVYPISNVLVIFDLAVNLGIATAVAFSIDQNLFILSKYKQELQLREDPVEIVSNVVDMSMHTVLVSGMIIVTCYVLNVVQQDNLLMSLGIICGLTTFFCVTTNLLLTPTILIHQHETFKKCKESD